MFSVAGAVHCCKRETKVCRVLFKRVGTSKGRAARFLERFQICCISSTWSRYRRVCVHFTEVFVYL